MKDEIVLPEYAKTAFHCPHCGVFADQYWSDIRAAGVLEGTFRPNCFSGNIDDIAISKCRHCDRICMWVEEYMEYPRKISVAPPDNDLPEDIKKDYLEAAKILQDSPRGAAALLRLCVQKLCIFLGQKGKNLNDDIKKLVEAGLPAGIQKAMDIVRVTGDNAVHPGEIDLNDNPEIAHILFRLVNLIAERMITGPKELDSLYDEIMPEGAKEAVKKRDNKKAR